MVTIDKDNMGVTIPYNGLSTDVKPTTYDNKVIPNGSTFFEMDTQSIYFFDEASGTWLDQP